MSPPGGDAVAEHPGNRPQRARPRRRVVRLVLIGAAGLALVVTVVVVLAFLRRSTPTAVSVDDAMRRYRRAPGAAALSTLGPGVLRAAGGGSNGMDRLPTRQEDGSSMPVTIESIGGGCSRWRIDYNTSHSQALDLCATDGRVDVVAQRTDQSWDLGVITVSNTGEFRCDPPVTVRTPVDRPGDQQTRMCRGTNSSVDGPATVELRVEDFGETTLRIGGDAVAAVHQRWVQTLRGTQAGVLRDDWWFAASDGLPLRSERDYQLSTPTPLGDVRYTESGRWTLTSLERVG